MTVARSLANRCGCCLMAQFVSKEKKKGRVRLVAAPQRMRLIKVSRCAGNGVSHSAHSAVAWFQPARTPPLPGHHPKVGVGWGSSRTRVLQLSDWPCAQSHCDGGSRKSGACSRLWRRSHHRDHSIGSLDESFWWPVDFRFLVSSGRSSAVGGRKLSSANQPHRPGVPGWFHAPHLPSSPHSRLGSCWTLFVAAATGANLEALRHV